jgi:hypothetical protein
MLHELQIVTASCNLSSLLPLVANNGLIAIQDLCPQMQHQYIKKIKTKQKVNHKQMAEHECTGMCSTHTNF